MAALPLRHRGDGPLGDRRGPAQPPVRHRRHQLSPQQRLSRPRRMRRAVRRAAARARIGNARAGRSTPAAWSTCADSPAGSRRMPGSQPSRIANLVLAVNEVATNSVVHGGGKGSFRIWRDAGALSCEIRDAGRIDKPAGRQGAARGRRAGPAGCGWPTSFATWSRSGACRRATPCACTCGSSPHRRQATHASPRDRLDLS